MSSKPVQLPLAIQNRDTFSLDDFYIGDNAEVVVTLEHIDTSSESFFYLWGESGVGVSFLAQAVANRFQAPYISLNQIPDILPDILDGLWEFPLVCIDDLDAVKGRAGWQEALFHFFNQSRQLGNKIIFASHCSPNAMDLELADLQSRLFWGQSLQVKGLSDSQKCLALIERAALKGLVLETSVAQYLLNRYSRDIQQQFKQLDQLDKASLSEQRKLTIPFVKRVLEARS